jgi:hypothetical protein
VNFFRGLEACNLVTATTVGGWQRWPCDLACEISLGILVAGNGKKRVYAIRHETMTTHVLEDRVTEVIASIPLYISALVEPGRSWVAFWCFVECLGSAPVLLLKVVT